MTGASKILTVSYGTFSCTLEGFDDPFNTMKAIAEYFRDLAAEDRYFGAEPPQPDAAMLHRIAEREIQRRVEAKIQDNGVILRAEEAGTLPAPATSAAAVAAEPVAAPQAPAAPAPQPQITMPARPAPQTRALPTVVEGETVAESVAEKLSRLRKAAAIAAATDAAPTDAAPIAAAVATSTTLTAQAVAADSYSEDEHADPILSAPMDVADMLPEDAAVADDMVIESDLLPEDQPREADAASEAADDAPASLSEAGDLEAQAEAEDVPDLAAMDGVPPADLAGNASAEVSVPPQTYDDDEGLLAALAADTTPPVAEPAPVADALALADTASDDALLASLGALIDPEDSAEDKAETAPAQDQPDTASALVTDPETTVEPSSDAAIRDVLGMAAEPVAEPVADAFVETTLAEPEQTTETVADSFVETTLVEPEDDAFIATNTTARPADDAMAAPEADPFLAAAVSAPVTGRDPDAPVRPVRPVRTLRPTAQPEAMAPAAAAQPEVTKAPAEAAPATTPEPISVDKLHRARARVIKIRRAEPVATPSAPAAPTLSAEAEAALAAELAALESDLAADTPAAAPAEQPAASEPVPAARRLAPAADEAVNRLMDEASTQMDVPDTKRRQSAIAHLKAAVAATIAERKTTGNTLAASGSERLGAYRDDLAKVVRPAAAAPTERPAPLVLVSEQRIDRPAPMAAPVTAPSPAPAAAASVQPVRPRRPVSGAGMAASTASQVSFDDEFDDEDEEDENIFDQESGFPEFAERIGATELSDLLEAAAAYIACVEGRDSFTRPQLMRHVSAATDSISREDGLRSFGTLLRDGVIERSRRGQFAISDRSSMLVEAKKIAG